ncbi:MAG TPA: glycine--tRNA ligase [Candidatus Omnitrophota bacterium]|nr:glycine--tRNA ligase [Candidatus Omnitrophota bacterium]
MPQENLMDKIVSLCKRRGFVFQSSEIYGGLSNSWDYGPLGAELKRNVKNAWWKSVVQARDDVVGLDAAILMHPKTWEASGHTQSFSDILVDCKKCKKRFRKDKIGDTCPDCGSKDFTEGRAFNLMLKTYLGPVEDASALSYLRPETAQGIFVNFSNVLNSARKKLPFGIAQIGKSFRNEVTPGNFTFRTREFEQMEIEYFVEPKDADKFYEYWVEQRFNWYLNLGLNKNNLKKREHQKDELAHYAKACTDVEYNFPFGWSELEGIANRTDFDLRQHAKFSGQKLTVPDLKENDGYPYIIEPSGGVDRSVLAFLVDAYFEEEVKGETRAVLKLHSDLAPIKVAVLPLLKKNDKIVELAQKIKRDLQTCFVTVYDDTAAIGKLYRRQDEVGTPFCVTVDVQSLEDKQVTVRDRDTMKQDRISTDQIKDYIFKKLFNK